MSLEVETVLEQMDKAAEMYHRLVLIVALSGAGKTPVLREVGLVRDMPCVNVNLELSKRMLDLTARQRALHVGKLLRALVGQAKGTTVLLDNIEVLFDLSLKQDPLRLLKDVARSRTVVASWNGTMDDQGLSYAQPDHPEYKHYPLSEIDFICVTDRGIHP